MQSLVKISFIKPRYELSNLFLCDRRREINIPCGQAGKSFRIAGEQAVQKSRSAAQVAEDKQRFFDGMIFIVGEEHVIQPEAKPVDEHADRPDDVKEGEEEKAFAGEAGGGVF